MAEEIKVVVQVCEVHLLVFSLCLRGIISAFTLDNSRDLPPGVKRSLKQFEFRLLASRRMRFWIHVPQTVVERSRVIVAIFLAFSSLVVVARLKLREESSWQHGDWLINYSEGFIRRGLLGQGLLFFSDTTGVPLGHLLFGLQAGLFVALVAGTIVLMFRARAHFAVLLIAVSPAFLLFSLWDPGAGFRKELVALAIISWLLVWSFRDFSFRPIEKLLFILVWVLFPPLLVLIHEGLFFAIPILLSPLVLLGQRMAEFRSTTWRIPGSACFLATVAFTASVISSGNENQARAICDSVVARGYEAEICDGAINALGWDLQTGLSVVIGALSLWYLPAMLLAAIPFVFLQYSPLLRKALGIGLLSLLPLFLVGADWGRWIYIAVAVMSLVIIRFIGTFDVQNSNGGRRLPISGSTAGIILMTFAFGWHITAYDASNILPGAIRLFQSPGVIAFFESLG